MSEELKRIINFINDELSNGTDFKTLVKIIKHNYPKSHKLIWFNFQRLRGDFDHFE